MPETISATRRPVDKTIRPDGRAAELKWLAVLTAMLVAIVMDGIAVSDLSKSARDAISASDQAAITLPSDRCDAGCSIMVASNQSIDRIE